MTDDQSKNILVISVDREFIDSISATLFGAGFQVLLAHDEATLSDVFARAIPDLLIVDIGVSGENNIAILQAIRAQSDVRIAMIPVIAASQNGDLIEIAAAIKLGVKDYFVKSNIDSGQVLMKIARQFPSVVPSGVSPLATEQGTTAIPVASISAEPLPPAPPSVIKLLIVEDDKFLRDLAVQKISKEGLNVVAAVDGEQGIAFAEKELPDIILLDILLPGIDGFEVLRRVRANPALAKTKVAMLSNFGQREDIEKALNAGADQFMVKANYTLDEIVEEVKKIVAIPRKLP